MWPKNFLKGLNFLTLSQNSTGFYLASTGELTAGIVGLLKLTNSDSFKVLHFGHWLPGAADFLDEEQEQVFATQGPRANTSKHMSRSGTFSVRPKILKKGRYSASLFYHNEEKDSKLPEYLVKCYHTALLRVPEYQMKLENMMTERNVTVENLDAILLSLKDRARQVRNKRSSSSWELGKLQLDLEDSSKARTRNRAEMSSVAADYDLIDTWMLMKRYEEAVELNKKELSMFLFSCERSINALNDEIQKREDDRRETYFPLSLIARSKDVAQATEILRLQKVIAEAREIFRQVQEGFRFEDEDYLDMVEKGQAEDILLEADDFDAALEEDDLIMGDCETDEDDCCDWLNGEDCNFTTEA
ncbi:hypothetical protein OUZ56_023803 [Daphnia magna]|uniref:Uncharacterized protein n=1 Tax=Daphnia magna TaxID=35525 RepID=A0ABR0AZJ8_9CRUS|nr:hypothetical protein OUZ56_023803 [Daphnia magna]